MAVRALAYALLPLLLVFGATLAWQPTFLIILNGQVSDALMRWNGPQPAPSQVSIIAFDDAALAGVGPHQEARAEIAEMVELATQAGARAIALDYLFVGQTPHDARLAKALADSPQAYLALAPIGGAAPASDALRAAILRSGLGATVTQAEAASFPLGPDDGILAGALLGHVAIVPDADGVLRHVQPQALVLGVSVPSLALAASAVPPPATDQIRLSYYGPEATIETFSPQRVREGLADLKDRVVFVGTSATGFGDRYATPFDKALPGVEVLATAAANLLSDKTLIHGPRAFLISLLCAFAIALLLSLALQHMQPVPAFLCLIAACALALVLSFVAQRNLYLLFTAQILISLLLTAALGALFKIIEARREGQNLARFTSPALRDTVRRHGSLGTGQREIDAAAICIDVVGFTARSAGQEAAETARFLQQVHSTVERSVLPFGGVVEHFTGDGVMVIFGLSPSDAPPRTAAMQAIAEFEAELGRLNQHLRAAQEPAIRVRISAHAGRALPSILGGQEQGHITITGPVLIGAARLQEVAKTLGADLIVSAAMDRNACPDLRDFGAQEIRGWAERLSCFGRVPAPETHDSRPC